MVRMVSREMKTKGKTELITKRWAILRGKEDNLIKDLEETTLSCKKLGKKYGVSRQAVYAFFKRQGIKRPLKAKGHQTKGCRLCQKLIQISKKRHSEFISIHTIAKVTGRTWAEYVSHLRTLRSRGLVNPKFGRLRSMKAERAYTIYFTKRLPIRTIGWKVGLKNFSSIIKRHRELGWNVPPPLYVYYERGRSRMQSKIQRRNQR
jgi:biotin operon repressor